MEKNKGIFTMMLAICVLAGIGLIMVLSLTTVNAYAETEVEEQPFLKSIYVGEGNNIEFSKDIHSYIVDVSSDIEETFLRVKPIDENYVVRINGQVVTKEERFKKNLELSMGKNKVTIEVSDNENFSDDEYYKNIYSMNQESNYSLNQNNKEEYEKNQEDSDINVSKYVVYIYRGGETAVFLKNITIDENNMGFNQSNKSYNLEIDDNNKLIELEMTKFDEKDTIYVNNNILKNTNSLKLKFNGIGKYTVIIDILDNETNRKGTYTLNIYYGISISPNLSDSINSALKPNQWVIVNGRWQLNDSLGKPIRSQWYYDDNYKAFFYFNGRGYMKTGWVTLDGNTYYLGNDGRMQSGWVEYEDDWYYLDHNGVMRTGWIKDKGDWYYLNQDGSMKTGWLLNNGNWYYLSKNGKMKTKWLLEDKEWYYLSKDGSMKLGWLKYNDEWYYLNSDGTMKSGEWLYYNENWYYINYSGTMRCGWLSKDDKYYYFNEDGSMRTEPLIMDDYLYEFNEDGSANFD